jgi:hypothetical protein
MSLCMSKLQNVRHLPNGAIEARCPACAESGHDRTGEHLWIKPDGRFGCCANPKDSEHRKHIFALAGDSSPKQIKVKPTAVKVASGRTVTSVLGRLGRVFATADSGNEVRTPRTPELKSNETDQPEQSESRTPRTPQNISAGERENSETETHTLSVAVTPSEPSESNVLVDSETAVRGVRLPHFTPGGTLVIPFDSPERFHWWKGGQSIAETRSEILRSFHEPTRKETNDARI